MRLHLREVDARPQRRARRAAHAPRRERGCSQSIRNFASAGSHLSRQERCQAAAQTLSLQVGEGKKLGEDNEIRFHIPMEELEKVKKGEQELISALAQAQAECIEARTKASVLERPRSVSRRSLQRIGPTFRNGREKDKNETTRQDKKKET